MIRRLAMSLAASAGLLSSCAPLTQELRHSGGYAGSVMDRRLFDASRSKQLQLLRFAIVVAMASRVGNASTRDGREADAFVEYLRNATDEINFLAGHIYPRQGVAICTRLPDALGECDTYAAFFEADLPQLEYKTVRLVIAALPQRQAAAFANAAARGDVMSAAWKALRVARASLDGLHRGAATYRSALEIAALVKAREGCAAGGPASAEGVATVDDAVRCLGLSPDTLRKPLGTPSLPGEVPPTAFEALIGIARTACRQLPVNVPADDAPPGQTDPVKERRESCEQLRFAPRLRYNGLRAAAPVPAPAAVVDPGGGS